jgi:hypothetical protein
MNELACIFVGSVGLLKSTTHYDLSAKCDSFDIRPIFYLNMHPHAILHVSTKGLPLFVRHILPTISHPFKLLTNNSDSTLPDDYPSETQQILNHPLLLKWFSQNWVGEHKKVIRIPIGLDYHSLTPTKPKQFAWSIPEAGRTDFKSYPTEQEADLLHLRSQSREFWRREVKAYGNFQFLTSTRYGSDRKNAVDNIPKELVFYEPLFTRRIFCWRHMIEYTFVLSPHGNGLDCHRTWEALVLGCIPIVKSSGIDPVFEGLPVWIVNDWNEVTREKMEYIVNRFRTQTFNYEKLKLSYWQNLLRSA